MDGAGDAVDLCVDGSRDEGEVMIDKAIREPSPSPSRRDWTWGSSGLHERSSEAPSTNRLA